MTGSRLFLTADFELVWSDQRIGDDDLLISASARKKTHIHLLATSKAISRKMPHSFSLSQTKPGKNRVTQENRMSRSARIAA